jgi:hypothetical protein
MLPHPVHGVRSRLELVPNRCEGVDPWPTPEYLRAWRAHAQPGAAIGGLGASYGPTKPAMGHPLHAESRTFHPGGGDEAEVGAGTVQPNTGTRLSSTGALRLNKGAL